jgi:hypothetical protein
MSTFRDVVIAGCQRTVIVLSSLFGSRGHRYSQHRTSGVFTTRFCARFWIANFRQASPLTLCARLGLWHWRGPGNWPSERRGAGASILAKKSRSRDLIGHPKRRAVLRAASPAVVETGGGNVGVPQPFLHFGQVGAPIQRVGCGGGAQRMGAKAGQIDPGRLGIFAQHAIIDRPVGKGALGAAIAGWVLDWPEERPLKVVAVAASLQIVVDAPEGQRMGGHIAQLATLAQHPEMRQALAALEVSHPQAAEFGAAQAVVEEDGQDRPVAFAFETVAGGRFQERPGLAVAQGRGLAFAGLYFRALYPPDRVVVYGTHLAEVIKKGCNRGQLTADGAPGQAAALEVCSPSDQVSASDLAHLFGEPDAGEPCEVPDVEPVGAPGAGVVEIGEPLQFGRHIRKSLELGSAEPFCFRSESNPQGLVVFGIRGHSAPFVILITPFINTTLLAIRFRPKFDRPPSLTARLDK